MKILDTVRLTLRELTVEDAPFLRQLLNDPAYIRFIGDRHVRTEEEARTYLLNGPIASYERHGFGLYLVETKADQIQLGLCGLIKRDTLPDVDIGYAFLPQFRGAGYAYEAAAAIMAYGKATVGLQRIVAIVTPDNERSIHLLEKLGLTFAQMITWPADGAELKLYAIDYQTA